MHGPFVDEKPLVASFLVALEAPKGIVFGVTVIPVIPVTGNGNL